MLKIDLKQRFSIKKFVEVGPSQNTWNESQARPWAGPGLALGQARLTQSVVAIFWDRDPPLGSQNHKIAT